MTENPARDDSGQFVVTRSPSDVLDAMESLEPYTTGELADVLGWPRRSVYQVLQELAEDNCIRKKKPEPRRAIWMRPLEDGETA
jgi:DNA-binding MarR family transcriptional regulator